MSLFSSPQKWTSPSGKFELDLAAGFIPGLRGVGKFGRAPAAVDAGSTDIWDYAATQNIWLAPTAARIHTLVSSQAADDGDPVGVGAQIVRVYYLPDWDSMETYEDVTLNGITGVAMLNAAVMINRMKVIAHGTTNVNVGNITATAADDATITATILVGNGQTQMAIMGVSSLETAYVLSMYGSLLQGVGATVGGNLFLLACVLPETEPDQFITKHSDSMYAAGTSDQRHKFGVAKTVEGPAIIKVAGTASAAGTDVSGGFDIAIARTS